MNTARRWYIYLVCAISLQVAVWAVIALLRNLVAGGSGTIAFIALQIAIVLIALPLFLVHWLWAQRLAEREIGEREAGLRRFYLYGMLAGFLGPIVANAFSLISTILWAAAGRPGVDRFNPESSLFQTMLYHTIPIIVLAALWFYQQQVIAVDAKIAPETGNSATIRRLYLFLFSAWGLTMTTLGVIHVLRWIMLQFGRGGNVLISGDIGYLTDEITRLIVGLPLWLIFWRQAQNLFIGPDEEERDSALRRFYLYTTVFVAALSAVTNATIILAAFFRRLLSLPSQGDIRTPLPIIIGMALIWALHAYLLRGDAEQMAESSRQAGVRRLYLYLIAAIGLAAFLVGFSGDISVLIRSATQFFSDTLREQLAWFTAALIAGLPVWLLPWRQAQAEAVTQTPAGIEERRSTVRKIYLYFYLFVATMTVLSSAIYILYRILTLVLGGGVEGNLLSGLAQAIAYALVGIGVWVYHGSALRGDQAINRYERTMRLKDVRIVVMDVDNTGLGQSMLSRLRQEEPDLNFDLISLPSMENGASVQGIRDKLSGAGMIVGPWLIAVDGGAGGLVSTEVARAVVSSPARKILIPTQLHGWDWAGVDRWNMESLVQQTVRAVKQWVDGEEIRVIRPMGIGGIIGTILGVVLLLILLGIPLLIYFARGF